jgi:phage-related protein
MAVNIQGGQVQFSAVIDTDEFDSGLSKLGSGLATAGKVAVATAAAVATAVAVSVGAIVAGSVKNFSQFEQMAGGIEALMGSAADSVKKQALEAAATTGLSANQYMETFTQFSGTLLRGLNNDYAEAARIGDMAVKDMADNAATTGTSMETLRETYASLARGNYEMLDSLNLGFAGTQQGMADLINESGVMGEGFIATAENIKSIPFDKQIQAIHEIQQRTHMTGRAAEEAMKTISGSLGVVQGSWTNLLTAFGTGNTDMITQSFDTLVKGAVALATNVTAIIPNIINGITQIIAVLPGAINQILPIIIPAINTILTTITEVIPKIIPVFVQILISLVNVILDNLPKFIDAAVQIIVSIISGLAQAAPTIIPKILEAIESMITTIVDNLPKFLDAAIKIILAIIDGLAEAIPRIIPQVVEAIVTITNTLLENLPKLIESGIKLLVAVIEGLAKALPQLIDQAGKVIDTLVKALTTPQMIDLLIHAAWDILFAVVKGIIQSLPKIADAAKQIGDSLEQGINNFGTAMLNAGKDLVVGLWNGIANKKDWILGQIKGFGASVLNGIKSFFGIKSPSRLFRDEIGKNMALGIGVGFTDAMDGVTKDMNMAMPVSDFDVNMMQNGSYNQSAMPQAVVNVHVGEERIASKIIDLINDRTRLQGSNAIFV